MTKKYLHVILIAAAVIGGVVLYQKSPFTASAYISTDVAGLSEAKAPETVELKNGDMYTLTASYVSKSINGTEYRMLAYNGSIPGPVIKVPQGAEVTIDLKNDTDMPTLLHSHGVRMDNQFDGSQTSQDPIPPGGSFSYKIKFPDAGMYWYHPHVREDFGQELGLYGNYLVVPNDNKYWEPVNREVPLVLDDILIDNGQIKLDKQNVDHTLMGRYGNVMLVNGETNYSLNVQKGEAVRFYVTNVANARPFNFTIQGAKMKLVGSDSGAYEKDQWVDVATLGPSERAVVEVYFAAPGSYEIENKTPEATNKLGTVVVGSVPATPSYASSFMTLQTHTDVVQSIDPFRQYFSKTPDKTLVIGVSESGAVMQMQMGGSGEMISSDSMMGASSDGIEWDDANKLRGSMSTTDNVKWAITDVATSKQNRDINWIFQKDVPVKIRIESPANSMHPMQHPIHFHGNRFLLIDRNGVEQTDLVWKDTVLVPAGQYVDILLDTSNPGAWMAHCHIAEHLEAGMMLKFKVE